MESFVLDSVGAGVLLEEKALQHEPLNDIVFRFHWGLIIGLHNAPNTGKYKMMKKGRKVI